MRSTIPDPAAACLSTASTVSSRAPRPNALWVSDFTYVATWSGFVYVAFVHRCVRPAHRRLAGLTQCYASFVLDALEQVLHERRPVQGSGLVHHSDRGSQYLALRYTERLVGTGIEPSVGSGRRLLRQRLAETINGLFKAEVIYRRRPWRSFEAVDYATLKWVDWYNHRRLSRPSATSLPPGRSALSYPRRRPSPGRLTQDKQPPKNTDRSRGDRVVSGAAVPAVSVQLSPYASLIMVGKIREAT